MAFPHSIDRQLAEWFHRPGRKPLVLRGARQTGKSTAVRTLGALAPLFLELNLERYEDLALIRTCRSADELLVRLQQRQDLAVLPGQTLLFLDEVQEHPEALGWLRFLHEDHPELAVIAAGSLLAVRLRDSQLPFPVGRVEFLRLEPLSFLEFLEATGGGRLAEDLRSCAPTGEPIDEGLHGLAMERFREFLLVGGLPEAVETWRTRASLPAVGRVHRSLHQAHVEDLRKYGTRGRTRHLELALEGAPGHYGARFQVRNFAPGEKDRPLAEALSLLEQAMVLHRVTPTSCTALPLVPRVRAARKLLPLDIGLALTQLGVNPEHLQCTSLESLMGGRLAEAFVGVQLLSRDPGAPRKLSFWTREGSANPTAEVDYLVPSSAGVLPVEVKAGAAGKLRSLHRFLHASGGSTGVRLCSSRGGTEELSVKLVGAGRLNYRLCTLPIYLAELVDRLR